MLSSPIEKLERLLSFYLDVLKFSTEEMRSLVRVKGDRSRHEVVPSATNFRHGLAGRARVSDRRKSRGVS